jgi:hypothetical protein
LGIVFGLGVVFALGVGAAIGIGFLRNETNPPNAEISCV